MALIRTTTSRNSKIGEVNFKKKGHAKEYCDYFQIDLEINSTIR